jgi:hypothetical protein
MRLRTTDLGVLSIIVFLITLWLLFARPGMRSESNWPLFYYLGLVAYVRTVGSFIEPYVVYASVITAMLIRFEFLSTGFVKFLRFIESVCLLYVLWQCFLYFVIV